MKQNPNKRFRLPAGDVNTVKPPIEPLGLRWIPPNRPIVQYQQHELKTCVFSSFASACHYKQLYALAAFINQRASVLSTSVYNMKKLEETVRQFYLPRQIQIKNYTRDTINIVNETLNLHQEQDIMSKLKEIEYPTIVVLQGEDDGCEHAVSIIGSWIFDSNLSTALPRTEASLDWCCMGKFKSVMECKRFFI